jgi:hypothetical protein
VHECQLLEHVLGGGGGAGLGRPLPALHPEPLEEHLPQLGRGVDVELPLGEAVDVLRERLELCLHLAAHQDEQIPVHLDPGPLHVGQDLDEGHLHRLVDGEEALLLEAVGHGLVQAQDDAGVAARGAGRRVRGRILRRDPARARAPLLLQELEGQILERVAAPSRVEEIGGQEGIEGEPGEIDTQPSEDDVIPLGVGGQLAHRRVSQERSQELERLLGGHDRGQVQA